MKFSSISKALCVAFSSLCLFSVPLSASFADSDKSLSAPSEDVKLAKQGRIVVLVVDISQSIREQIDAIVEGLCNEIVDKKLESGDYCVVVPLGDGRNADRADSFGVRFSNDKEKIKAYLRNIKTWMPKNLNTDIGAAMKKAFDYINLINSENTGDMFAPQVIFITDGEIFHSDNSDDPIRYATPDAIFEDPMMDPAKNSYENWWFLGIENEGVPLEHIKSIAKRVNAYPERYKVLKDMKQFGAMFDEWVRNIPEPLLPPKGEIRFSDVCVDGKPISMDSASYTVIPTDTSKFSWKISSTYKERMRAALRFDYVKAVFQDEGGKTFEFDVTPEAGNIELSPLEERVSGLNFTLPSDIKGRGFLKFDIKAEVTNLNDTSKKSEAEIPEWKCFVVFKTPAEIFIAKIKIPLIALAIVILIIVIVSIMKANAAIKVKIEVVGKPNPKARAYSMRVGKKAEFGSKAGIPFKLEGQNYPQVIGTFERNGSKSFKINPRDNSVFADGQEKILANYKLGTSIKLVLKDRSSVQIKFR